MSLYVYITPECEKDAKKHNRHAEMLRLKEKVELSQRITHFDNFPPPFLKKRFDRQIRLLADYRTRSIDGEEHTVVSFIRIYVRSSNEYSTFLRDSSGFGEKHLLPLVDNSKVDIHLREQLKVNPVPPKPAPSASEYEFLYRSFGGANESACTDEFICESEQWVRKVSDKKVEQILVLICDELPGFIDSDGFFKRVKVRNHTIIYRWFPNLRKLFLAGISDDEKELTAIENTYSDVLNPSENEVSEEAVLKRSLRTYTASLVIDEDGWLNVQRDSESNLALSPEETRVLESVHHHENGFPIFINGRAGSGKSTILYYLFADYINLYMELKSKGSDLHYPILFSCSEDLTRRAMLTVQNLIKCNPRWRKEERVPPTVPSGAFCEFHRYLLSLVPKEERGFFPADKFVDYASYRRHWEKQFSNEPQMRKEAGPDLSWHIIRSYIKGTSPEEYLEPEEYEHLPRKQKSVSQKAYEVVFSKVWESWYKECCDSKVYWDDQDLARYVFAKDLVKPIVPAVFCDESQDFTRVELDILFRLCLFVNRSLGHDDIARVPFAFAGDPFQTLNPTGFRWDAIQASFHDKLTDTLGENIHRDIEINYQELNLNYRSTEKIVRFCNLIQSMRASLFDLPKLRPQETWQFEENSPFPVWFDRNNKMLWNTLKDESDITIIVPCALNEEIDFVARDEDLRQIVRLDETNVPQNVLSPARAKGLEFGRVVLYAFADYAPNNLLSILDETEHDQDTLLPFEYFVNQLYVGASRPKNRLFIIDSQTGRDQLWKITSDETQKKMWANLQHGDKIWKDSISGFQVGTKESWSKDRGNPEENAKNYEQQGMVLRDPYLLRSAAMSYENMGRQGDALKCRAEALRFEEKYDEAGTCFAELGNADEALVCFWKKGVTSIEKITDLGAKFPDIINRIEYKVAHTFLDPSPVAVESILQNLCEQADSVDGFQNRLRAEKTFSSAIWEWATFCLSWDTSPTLVQIVSRIELLVVLGITQNYKRLAELFYKIEDMRKAVENWEKDSKSQNRPDYQKAKSILLADAYEKNPTVELSQSDAVSVSGRFIELHKYHLALQPLVARGSVPDLVAALAKVPRSEKCLPKLLIEFINTLVAKSEWDAVIEAAFVSLGSDPKNPLKGVAKSFTEYSSIIRNAIVLACAGSDDLVRLDNNMLSRYSDYFLKVIFRSSDWKEGLPLVLAGAAIERSGRQRDILPFYEKIWSDDFFSADEKAFARIRWIVTKEKQALREEKDGKRGDARRRMKEASDLRLEIGVTDKTFPEFPVLPKDLLQWNGLPDTLPQKIQAPHDPSLQNKDSRLGAEPPDSDVPQVRKEKEAVLSPVSTGSSQESHDTEIALGCLRLEFSPARGRVNITHKETMGLASFRTGKNVFLSNDVEFLDSEAGRFICAEWGLNCLVSKQQTKVVVVMSLQDRGVSVTLDFPFGVPT
jgi:tetratricopeptide (TPR) repeat protein